MGIITAIKSLAPLSIYLAGFFCGAAACGGKVKYALMMIVFLIPLRNVIEKVQSFPLGTQFIDILIMCVLVGWIVNAGNRGRFLDKSPLNAPSIAVMIYTFISLMLGWNYLHGGLGFSVHDPRVQDWKNFCLLPLLFFITLNNIQTKKEVWTLVGVMCVSLFFTDYYLFNQIAMYSSLVSREKITGTFQFLGPNEVAAFLNQYTLILMGIAYGMKNSRLKWLLRILILFNIYSILFLYSRGAYAGLFLGMAFLFAFKDKKLLVPIILIVLLWQAVLPQKVVERIKETKTESGELDASSQRRIDIWGQAFKLFLSNPVSGIGFGVFRYLGLDLGDTHNIYVKIITEQGLVGIIIFFLLLAGFVKAGVYLYKKGEDEPAKGLGLGFALAIVVLMVNNFFGDRWSYLELSAYLWVFGGLVCRMNLLVGQRAEPEKVRVQKPLMQRTYSPKPVPVVKKKKERYYDPQ